MSTKFKPGEKAIYFYTPSGKHRPINKLVVDIIKVGQVKARVMLPSGELKQVYLDSLQEMTKEFISKQAGSI